MPEIVVSVKNGESTMVVLGAARVRELEVPLGELRLGEQAAAEHAAVIGEVVQLGVLLVLERMRVDDQN